MIKTQKKIGFSVFQYYRYTNRPEVSSSLGSFYRERRHTFLMDIPTTYMVNRVYFQFQQEEGHIKN